MDACRTTRKGGASNASGGGAKKNSTVIEKRNIGGGVDRPHLVNLGVGDCTYVLFNTLVNIVLKYSNTSWPRLLPTNGITFKRACHSYNNSAI